MTIDFDRGIFSISADVPETVTNTFVAVPLRQQGPYFAAKVLANQMQSLDLLIDTGDNSSLSFNAEGWQQVFSTNQVNLMKTAVSGVRNQVVPTQVGRVRQSTLNGLAYTNLHVTLIPNPANPPHLGLGFFRRHRVIFDFANRKLYLRPGRQFFMPDPEDMSGLHLLRENQLTEICSVDGGSPAFNGGVRASDLITAINGRDAASLTLKEIRDLLQNNAGNRVDLEIERRNKQMQFEFALEKMI